MNKKRQFWAALVLCGACGVPSAAGLVFIPQYVSFAVANSDRPASDRERDVNRKPELVIAFAGIKPGQNVAELMPGKGYFTRLFCQIVGRKGHVYTVGITRAVKAETPPDAASSAPENNGCTNVTADTLSAADFKLPQNLDVVWTSENYHDLHNASFGKPDMAAFDRVIFNALKPGGVFMVEDHAAATGSGARDTETLHRIDPELVKQEVTGAGFVSEAASEALHNEDDAHVAKVFDLKGRSDRFLFKFRKPKDAQTTVVAAQASPAPAISAAPPAGAAAAIGVATASSPVTTSNSAPATGHRVVVKRLTGQEILGEPGSAEFVLKLTTTDGEFLYEVSHADLKDLAALASKYSQEK
jgi:predicted methyltransferase